MQQNNLTMRRFRVPKTARNRETDLRPHGQKQPAADPKRNLLPIKKFPFSNLNFTERQLFFYNAEGEKFSKGKKKLAK